MSLKDENAVIKAVMFKNSASRLRFIPENGMKVLVMGRASIYDRDGQYQFYIDDMQPDGVGALHVAFEQLKIKLGAQGLFDESRKRSLPPYPERIGVVTSLNGAALQDILNILNRRWPIAQILLYPVLVQGIEAPAQICRAIDYFSAGNKVDVLIVGRGGGSIEDLWAFNDENVALCIAECQVPVVSAVGHETDFTIADFVADMRAPTPSAAAELVTPDFEDVKSLTASFKYTLKSSISRTLESCSLRLDAAVSSKVMSEPLNAVMAHKRHFESLCAVLTSKTEDRLRIEKNHLAEISSKLDALSPLKVLTRGYSIASGTDGVISSAGNLRLANKFTLRLSDGEVKCGVLDESESNGEDR
jgi:exodeoxyribonuclease VII large subunit